MSAELRAIHEFATGTPVALCVLLMDTPDISATSGYTTEKLPIADLADFILGDLAYTQDLDTNIKNIFGAINELHSNISEPWTDVTGTLQAGSTSITLSDNAITTSSTIDVYTDTFGVNPTNMVVTTGQVVLTFPAQASNLGVKVRVT